jgi:four helix bundle protein
MVVATRPIMTPQDLRARFDRFADGVIALCRGIALHPLTTPLLVQLQEAATSAAANYRAACRAQTRPGFVAKLSIALEEADEAVGWLQRLSNQGIGPKDTVANLLQEASELAAILAASRRTAQGRTPRHRRPN